MTIWISAFMRRASARLGWLGQGKRESDGFVD
jgi:hypothetical protein